VPWLLERRGGRGEPRYDNFAGGPGRDGIGAGAVAQGRGRFGHPFPRRRSRLIQTRCERYDPDIITKYNPFTRSRCSRPW